ncbi:MAG: stage III sporulation protein AB, partial [Ruminococcus sp.]
MLKGIGLLCLVLCGGICGFLAANRVRREQEQLVHLAAFLHELEIRMWCHGGTLQELFQQLSEQETYQTFSFLSNTIIAMQQVSFTEAWKTSVQADKELSPDSRQMLCELGEE